MGRRRLTVRRYGFTACSAVALVAFVGIFEAGPSGAKAAVTGPLSPQVTLAPQTTLPAGAEALGPQNGTTPIQGDVVLNSKNQAGLANFVGSVSDPTSPQYGQYLASGAFATIYGADTSSAAGVVSWLTASGLGNVVVDPDGLMVHFQGSVAQVSRAFAVSIDQYQSGNTLRYAPSDPVSAPASLAPSISAVVGLSDFGLPQPQLLRDPNATPTRSPVPAGIGGSLTTGCQSAPPTGGGDGTSPSTLATAYHFNPLYQSGHYGAGVSVALFELESFNPSDIEEFDDCYGIDTRVTSVAVDGGAGTGAGSGEAALDVEAVAQLAPQAAIDVYEAPNVSEANVLDEYGRIANDDQAQVVSTSWGVCEADVPPAFVHAEEALFEQMAAQGQSVLAASGDSGSAGCYQDSDTSTLAADDPASDPYVTGVGGTNLGAPGNTPRETTWNDCTGISFANCAAIRLPGHGAGGGGLSSDWARPSWQPLTTPGSAACGTCREVPDVSASAEPQSGDLVYWDGNWIVLGGTSAAAPLWAAALALIDQGCATAIGFANPALYSAAAAAVGFNAVTTGENDYTDTNGGLYAAKAGYNMATGLGSPNVLSLELRLRANCPAVSGITPQSGASGGGTTVTIAGSNLSAAASVHFGKVAATFTYNLANNDIAAVAPAGAGSVAVTVTTYAGTSGPDTGVISGYSYDPLPVVSQLSVAGGLDIGGTAVTITGTGLTGATEVLFGNIPATQTKVLNSRTIQAISAPVSQPQLVDVQVVDGSAQSARSTADLFYFDDLSAYDIVAGWWVAGADGQVDAKSHAPFYGSLAGDHLTRPIVQMVGLASQNGYWLVASDGGIFAFGAASYLGSMGGRRLNQPVVGMAETPDGQGYWMVASDGGIFSFGDARFFGSTGALHLNKPIVGMASTPDGHGYWLVASDGGIFSFGDARFFGSTGAHTRGSPVVGLATTADGQGYWLAAANGNVYAFGDAPNLGSWVGDTSPTVAITPFPSGGGFWLVNASGCPFVAGDGVVEMPVMWTPDITGNTVGMVLFASPTWINGLAP